MAPASFIVDNVRDQTFWVFDSLVPFHYQSVIWLIICSIFTIVASVQYEEHDGFGSYTINS